MIELTISLEIELGERKLDFVRIFASFCGGQSLLRDRADKMAVETALSEPLSRPDSLLSGTNTGIFHGLCRKCPSIIRQSS
ncbi:hypothetical protein HDF13_003854 [Edaphobacter lichenicola]|nr:hypothetical protein [Edaphobacter lichenicola]